MIQDQFIFLHKLAPHLLNVIGFGRAYDPAGLESRQKIYRKSIVPAFVPKAVGQISLYSESIIAGFEAAQSQFDFCPLYAIVSEGCPKGSQLEMLCYRNIAGGNLNDIPYQSFDGSVVLNLLNLMEKQLILG